MSPSLEASSSRGARPVCVGGTAVRASVMVVVMSEIDASEVGVAVTVTTEVLMVVSRMLAVTV